MRWTIRVVSSLISIAAGVIVSSIVLSRFSISAAAVVEAVLVFWLTHIGIQVVFLRVLVHEPSIALAGLLAIASTIVALVIVNVAVSNLTIHGFQTYVFATLIIWVTTSIGDIISHHLIEARRKERREERKRSS